MLFVLQLGLGLFAIRTAASLAGAANSVTLDSATFTGATSGRVTKFLGIPYAQPPTGDRRFRLPEPISPYTGTVRATAFGPSCPQHEVRLTLPVGLASDAVDLIVNTAYKAVFPDSEDCLSINVVVPSSATPTSKLPVAVVRLYITLCDAVKELNPNAQWIYGGAFELGSASLYDGGPIVERSIQLGEPVIYVSMNYRLSAFGFLASQEVKDAGVGNLGLQDQREALRWIQKYISRADGTFLTDHPQKLVQAGKVANVPFVTGDCDDEGTLFSLSTLNISTAAQFRTYIKTFFMPQSTNTELDQVLAFYPSDLTKGSPFNTGILNALSPQFKRIAAFQGDFIFQAPRRFFLQQRSGKQNTWAYLSKRYKTSPFLGAFHATDILNVYLGGELGDYLINFVNNLDPNGPGRGIPWPKYTTSSPNFVTFNDNLFPVTITQDTFRKDAIDFLTEVTLANPL
ncbi:hypothetical protein EYR40_009675 [Pleurotus pulmonarius]|nr:hypothetical protein EYR40_009675 [Pleurotus pulmonarius]